MHAPPVLKLKGELNPEKNVGLNEYLREIKFCTGQESVDVVERKKIFNDKNLHSPVFSNAPPFFQTP